MPDIIGGRLSGEVTISGTVSISGIVSTSGTARQAGYWGVQVSGISTALPSGDNNIGNVDIATLPDEGQQTMANSISVAIASDQSAIVVVGNIAHDSTDSGNPVKIGTKAIDYAPDTQGEQGQTAVSANDRVDLPASLRGELIEVPKSEWNWLQNINRTYDTTNSGVSQSITCWQYREAAVGFSLMVSGTPTDILFDVEGSISGTAFQKVYNDFLGDWRYDDTAVGTAGIQPILVFPIAFQNIRIRATATGTSGTNTFTVSGASVYLRN